MAQRPRKPEFADPPPPLAERSLEEKQVEYTQLGGPTTFVNRFQLQGYPDGGVRITFLEQYSPDQTISPVFRTAVFMHDSMALDLARAIAQLLIPPSPPPATPLSPEELEALDKIAGQKPSTS